LDRQLNSTITNSIQKKNKTNELLGLGKYFISRLNNKIADDAGHRSFYRESIFCIVDELDKPYNSYNDIFNAIEFLTMVCRIAGANQKPKDYLNYAIDKLETSVYEDIHFQVYPGSFCPLVAASVILSGSEVTDDKEYFDKAKYFLDKYEVDFDQYQQDKRHSLKTGTLRYVHLYNSLFQKTGNTNFATKAKEWFDKSMIENKDALTGFMVGTTENLPELGIWDGYAGIGLALISIMDKRTSGWQYLITN